jgi:hypothetical protein
MPWQARLSDKPKFVELIYSGSVEPDELQEALTAAASLARPGQTHFVFADCTNLLGGHSYMDLYHLISLLEPTGIERQIKEAIVLPLNPAASENVKFYEVVCQNRGFNVKAFQDRTEALSWLCS